MQIIYYNSENWENVYIQLKSWLLNRKHSFSLENQENTLIDYSME